VEASSLEHRWIPSARDGAGVPGVVETGRACVAFSVYRKPNGKQQVVAVVAEILLGGRFPVPDLTQKADDRSPDSVLYDASDRDAIEVAALPTAVEINGHRANIEHEIRGFGGFLASLFSLPLIAMQFVTSVFVLKMVCTYCCESTKGTQFTKSRKILGVACRRLMFSLVRSLRTSLECIG